MGLSSFQRNNSAEYTCLSQMLYNYIWVSYSSFGKTIFTTQFCAHKVCHVKNVYWTHCTEPTCIRECFYFPVTEIKTYDEENLQVILVSCNIEIICAQCHMYYRKGFSSTHPTNTVGNTTC